MPNFLNRTASILACLALLVTAAGLYLGPVVGVGAQAAPVPLSDKRVLGTISGRVTQDDGSPAVGCSVIAQSTRYVTPAPAGEAVTDADGRYQITLDTNLSPRVFQSVPPPPPDTQFSITLPGQKPLFVLPASQIVTLPANLTQRGVNFQLTLGPQITLRVHDALTGQPVPGVTAKYLDNLAFSNDYKTAGVTDAQGQAIFRVPSLNAQLTLVPPGGTAPTVRAALGSNFYREVSLPQVQDVVWDVQTEPTTPPTTPTVWRGVVLTADGLPADGAKVAVLRGDAEFPTVTGRDGRWAVTLPPQTDYDYSYQFQRGAIVAEKGDQTAVAAPASGVTAGGMTVRLALHPLGSYAGTVVGLEGRPEPGVPVSCRGGLKVGYGAGINRSATTDAQGRFRLSGLPAGSYQVNLGGGPFGPETLPPSDPGYPYAKSALTLADGEQHDFGRLTVLPADALLAGQIVDSDGKPVSDRILAIVHGAHTNQMASLDSQGQFRVYHVVREPLTLDIYRIGKNGSTSLGQDSPDLFLKVPVQAGREDVRVALPAGALPPLEPPAAPVPAPPPAGPPQVTASGGMRSIAGLWLNYSPQAEASSPAQAVIHVTLAEQFGGAEKVWEGSLAEMDGMQLISQNNNGILKDRAGKTLWTGQIYRHRVPPEFQVITDIAKPNFLTLKDMQGRTLWSGLVAAGIPSVRFLDGYLAVIGPSGRIVWQQAARPGGFIYHVLNHGKALGRNGYDPPIFNGIVHFAVAPRQAVFQAEDGHIIYSGPLPMLMLTGTEAGKDAHAFSAFLRAAPIVCPFWVKNYRGAVTCTLYDAQGRKVQTSTSRSF